MVLGVKHRLILSLVTVSLLLTVLSGSVNSAEPIIDKQSKAEQTAEERSEQAEASRTRDEVESDSSDDQGYTRQVNVALASRSEVEAKVRQYFSDIPVMGEVARCESTFRHLDASTGRPLRGTVNSYDVGVMQINELYHLERAEELGIDIYSFYGNLEYARFLYQRKGTQPWQASKPCWGNSQLLAQQS